VPPLLLSAGVGMSMERCAVYLGASQPVSGTHVAMVTALLGAGHDIVFVFLLRWRPERFGTSADASAKVLRGWIDSSLGAEESAKRVVITPIQNDYEGAGLMRAHLGPDVDPELLVNYSKKYSPERFKPRIENDWMPLYRKEFPKAVPSFLVDELDPGGEGAAGTAAFVAALAGLRSARAAASGAEADEAAAVAALEAYRPACADPEGWRSYVDGLLGGANDEPFYTGDEKKEIEAAFFADASVREELAASPIVGDAGPAYFTEGPKNWTKFWKENLGDSKDAALLARFAANDALWRSFAMKYSGGAPPQSGCVVDCGSGHTSVMFYSTGGAAGFEVQQVKRAWFKHVDGGNLPLTDILPDASGGAFQGTTLEERLQEFIANLKRVLKEQGISDLSSLYIGATGGMRESIAQGKMGEAEVAVIRSGFEAAFTSEQMSVVRFEVLTGEQEARWEIDAAQIIWGGDAAKQMFPAAGADPEVGLFSGGGKSMQLGQKGSALSFPFSTFPKELEERQGAAPDAWLDEEKWHRWADELLAKVQMVDQPELFNGCFVGTAMNHRAAKYTDIAEQPITAGAAIPLLRAALAQFRSQEGELNTKMLADGKPGSDYPLARIAAMHTYRLATVLEELFHPEAQLFFARNGQNRFGEIDCEWTVGAFAEMAAAQH
jgi:hypothetical protein